ncbi:MAG: hypothetical protein NZM29_02070 [Nitrospira sp.]|nr:hypothetical protein [Nitrospira sp.]
MKLGSERTAGFWTPLPPPLEAVIARLESLSLKPTFALQREKALARALQPYLREGMGRLVVPLPQETELANLFLCCDFYPDDGQLSLIEQLRDVVTEHIPDEERLWLDPLKHSYMDLFELASVEADCDRVMARSLGDGTTVSLPQGDFMKDRVSGCGLLTRVIPSPKGLSDTAVWGGCGLVLSPEDATTMMDTVAQWRRELEIETGSFALGEWREFAKRYGYTLLWAFAQLRMDALVDAVVHVRYRRPDGQPYLYAVALYDHHARRSFAEQLSAMEGLEPEESSGQTEQKEGDSRVPPASVWVQREMSGAGGETVARLTLTSGQLVVECDSPERLDRIKHQLAAALGFSLHFRDETIDPPARKLSVTELMAETPPTVVVTPEEDRVLLSRFLEKAYLEWSDQPHVALGGHTPRHAVSIPAMRERVGALIDEMAAYDLGRQRTGLPSFDYNRLRAHVGLDEVSG